ncbi:DUF7931 domain-containing protein [Quatrionicoccus australiensis]|uniref:DUF7931 domain-containing protein n=1 Tax=Quatrionicoccus australiensis TaxID=138118 RepID=UPI001CFA0D79|nr:hypothetical protein [Quatrionicoccus australiensis]MCB4359217.1 hypothetical protein [Quatrionicoccus australiensis]
MARELITSWGDYQSAIDRLLSMAEHRICIYDEDLAQLRLESSGRHSILKHLLRAENSTASIRLALRNGEPLRRQNPLTMGLLASFDHKISALETPPGLAHLRDSMILVDDRYGLIRFERDLPRSKLLIDEPEELRSYLTRFEEIWREEGSSISATTLGL